MSGAQLLRLMKPKSNDNQQTPPAALVPLLPYLPESWFIWEPACGRGNLVRALARRGYRVIGTDIQQGERLDFLTWTPSWIDDVDLILTNPPYSLKDEFIRRCYELGKPWALLMPLTALGGQKRQNLWREYGVQLVMLGRRVHFDTGTGKSACWFESAWFTWGLNLPRDIIFGQMPPQEEAK